MNRLGIGHFCSRNNGWHVEITQRRRSRPDTHRLFRQFDVLGISISFRINHHRLDAQFTAGALDTQSNFATIGNQNFFKHGLRLVLFNNEQRLTVFHGLPVVGQDASHRAGLVRLDFIEDFHGLDDAQGFALFDGIADFHKRLGTWSG